jgi:hypothetical protein
MQVAARGTRSPRRTSHVHEGVDSLCEWTIRLEKDFSWGKEVRRPLGCHSPRTDSRQGCDPVDSTGKTQEVRRLSNDVSKSKVEHNGLEEVGCDFTGLQSLATDASTCDLRLLFAHGYGKLPLSYLLEPPP